MTQSPKILALSGSLRAGSTNTAVLRSLGDLLPEGVGLELYDYRQLPFFDADLDPVPEAVERFRAAVADADGLLIATPEYNHSVPGGLKNALDWASRPAGRSSLHGKPTGIVSASASFVGGARAQAHLRGILASTGTPLFPWPELLVGRAHEKVADGRVVDETTLRFLGEYADGFADWLGVGEDHLLRRAS